MLLKNGSFQSLEVLLKYFPYLVQTELHQKKQELIVLATCMLLSSCNVHMNRIYSVQLKPNFFPYKTLQCYQLNNYALYILQNMH